MTFCCPERKLRCPCRTCLAAAFRRPRPWHSPEAAQPRSCPAQLRIPVSTSSPPAGPSARQPRRRCFFPRPCRPPRLPVRRTAITRLRVISCLVSVSCITSHVPAGPPRARALRCTALHCAALHRPGRGALVPASCAAASTCSCGGDADAMCHVRCAARPGPTCPSQPPPRLPSTENAPAGGWLSSGRPPQA